MPYLLWSRLLVLCVVMTGLFAPDAAMAQEADPDETREAAIVARFMTVLEKSPKRGTALDKVYGFHVERGSLESLIKTYRDKATAGKGPDAASAWMIVGLMESLRGQDAASVDAFSKAEELDAANYLASYYLGQSQVLIGQPDKAAESLERAIQRKPSQADQLEIFQALGRVYQRAQKNDKALGVWSRLEKQFPNDARVQEQIATTLLEENEFEAALPRFENLAKTSKDKYRQSQFQMEVAEIKVRLGKSADAIREFERLLGQLNPDNWLYREVRRRIENVYLRTDDQSGLIAYYEAWTKKNPEDLEAISRLSRLLAGQGRGAEAQSWLEKGLKTAPSRKELRHALIAQLMYEQKFPEAIAQYELLDKYEPNNPDTLRDWGRLILKDTKKDEATRHKEAAAIWRRLTAARPKDPLTTSQVAELFRNAEMVDDALGHYRKAIELAPEAGQYREYLGEYYHSLKRRDEALATWRQMAEGKARSAANLARLAEVLAGFGYLAEAVESNADACKLDAKDINLQIKQADLLSQSDRHAEALKQLAVVQKLAASDEEREAWLQRELKELQSLEQLKDRTAAAEAELKGLPDPQTDKEKQARAEKWFWLARAYEAERLLKDAAAAVGKASELAPQSIPILMSTARILESQQNLLAAVETNTRLAAIDRRYRTEYLKKVAQLEISLGRRDKAIQAGRDVLASAPGNPELYEFFSQLCFQLGENEEGLQALRRSVRVNPSEPKGLLLLASALSEQFRTGESIELYWRAFEKAANLDDRLAIVPKLTELYLQTNQLDRMLERLENRRREPNQQREMTICIAQAYQSAGDDGNARQELEKLLTEDTRDTQLLQQLVKLCEQDGDLEAAIRFQHQINKIVPGKEGIARLAQLLMKSGESEEATALLTRATAEEKDPEQLIKSIDSLLTQKNYEQVLGIIERHVRDQPRNWELLYREGAALFPTKPDDAKQRFEAILTLNLSDDELSLTGKSQLKKMQAQRRSQQLQFQEPNAFVQRSQYAYQIRRSVGLDQENYYSGMSQQQQFWTPHDFGAARMACFAWMQQIARKAGQEEEYEKQRQARSASAMDRRGIIDAYYQAALRHDNKEQYLILKKLSYQTDANDGIKSMYLRMLSSRAGSTEQFTNEETGEVELKIPPLDAEELEHVLTIYKGLDDSSSMFNYGQSFTELIIAELKRSGRKDEADALMKETIEKAQTPIQVATVLSGSVQRGDFATSIKLLDRLAEMKSTTPATSIGGAFNYTQYISSPQYQSEVLTQLMARRAQKKELGDVLALWDRYVLLAVSRYEADQKQSASTKRRNANQNPYGSPGYYYIWTGNSQRAEQVDFPLPNEIYDHASLQMLRQSFAVFRESQAVPDLIAHFQKALKEEKKPEGQQLFWKMGLGYLFWWNDDKDDALTVLTDVAKSLPANEEMSFELARLHEKRNELATALEIIESLPASDQQTMQKREIAALRLSVNSGNIDRARTAAERLFGLRLDTNLQIQLARQMHQLGMHEQAEAVLSRAGRQAGNKTDVLMNLMQQYQSQGKNDVATQIAHQLLRRSSGSGAQMSASGRVVRSNRDDGSARQQALQVMKRSGKLPEMIKKVEDQLAHSPKSQKLLESLIEYYTAAGNDKKVTELSAKYAETKGDDPQFRYQLAMQLVRDGKHKESLEHFKVALKKDPRLLRNGYWEIQNAFEGADKLDDLATLYEEIDLKSFRQSVHELTNLISNMSRRDKTKDRAVSLFKKAWLVLPDERSQLLSNLNGDVFWKMPEIYDYARQGIIPSESALRSTGRWIGFSNVQTWNNDGKIVTLLNRFLTLATENKKLDEVAVDIEAAREKLKNWEAGEALLAMVNLRRGRIDEGRAVFEKLLPTLKGPQQIGYYTHWEIAQELMAHESCIDLAIQYLETAIKEPELMTGNEFPYTPGKPLAMLYKQKGRKDDARRVILAAMNAKSPNNYGNQQYEIYRHFRNVIALGNEVRTLGFPVDAIRLYQESLARTDDLVIAQRYGGDNMKTELQNGFQAALKELKPESLPELLMGAPAAPGKEPEPIDLVLLIDSRDLDKTSLTSALGRLMIELTAKPDMVAKTSQALADVRARRPGDISAMILSAQLSISSKNAESTRTAVSQLVSQIDQEPLEPLPAKGGFTPAQRQVAQRQTALWLIARECLKQESLRADGAKLGDRALEASRRISDNGYTMAILREWGQIALDAGDRQAAERRWTEMLDVVIPKPVEKPKPKEDKKTSLLERERTDRALSRWEQLLAPGVVGQLAAPVQVLSTRSAAPAAQGVKGNVVTLAQFEQAGQVARLAAENGFIDLSMKAIAQSLHAGPPVEAIQEGTVGSLSGFPAVAQATEQSVVVAKVEQRLVGLETIWRQRGVDDAAIYDALKLTIMPDARPLEVFLYPRSLAASTSEPQSLGLLLVRTAIRARKTDDLLQRLQPRLQQPLGELPARILMMHVALASGDKVAAKEQLETLARRLKQDSLQYSNELACHVAIPATRFPELAPQAVALWEDAVEHFAQNIQQGRASTQEEPMRSYRFALARIHFRNGDAPAGKKHLDEYLRFLVPLYRNYSGDYGQYRRRQELIKIAAEYARAGLQSDSLDCLAQYADLPLSRGYGQEGPGRAGAMILSGLAQLPPAEQYELLKAWTLPTPERRSARMVAGLIPADMAPSQFDAVRGGVPRGPRETRLGSTAELLVQSARQSGRLTELKQALQPFADQNVENAKVLSLLARVADGEGEKMAGAYREYLDERQKNIPKQGDYQNRPQLQDAVLALAAMRDPQLVQPGRHMGLNFFQHCTRVQEHLLMTMMRHEYNSSLIGAEMSGRLDRNPTQTGLEHWTAGATVPARTHGAGAMPMWWTASEGLVTHVCGPDQDHLYFKYPLMGTFELSCEGWLGGWSEANTGYGGVVFVGLNGGNDTTIQPVGNRNDVVHKLDPPERGDHFNRIRLKVDPESVRYYVNGHLIHTERNAGVTSPWFFLHCDRVWQTCFRDIQITGKPVIPREVKLSSGDLLMGWSTDFYGESQPARPAVAATPSQVTPEYDWQSREGEIHGRLQSYTGFGSSVVQQSRLYYDRPLLDGDRLRYEFWYEPGEGGCHVHPALDRLALLMEPDGVRLHWMTDGSGPEDAYGGLLADNAITDKSIQKGKVTLNDKAWNTAEIALVDGRAVVTLNGTVVCERPIEHENSRQFGFYHDKSLCSSRIRNVVLTGNWPETLTAELQRNLLAPSKDRTDADRRLLSHVIEEKFRATDVDGVLRQARLLPLSERYEALKSWVLPNADHGTLRIYADTAPADPLAVTPLVLAPVKISDAPATEVARPARRQRSGGELIAPALDLVAAARDLGKLDELADLVNQAPESPEQVKRSKLAMQVLVAIARRDMKQALASLAALTPARDKGLSDAIPVVERWPELVAAWEATQVPELRSAALALLEVVVDSANRKGVGYQWEVTVRAARNNARYLLEHSGGLPEPAGVSEGRQWAQGTLVKAESRGYGIVPRWYFSGHETGHLAGYGNDLIYFQSPLRGTFSVEGEVSTYGWREGRIMYAAQWAASQYTNEAADLGNLYRNWVGPKFPRKLDPMGEWCRVKMDVTPDKVVYYVNDQQIHEHPLTNNPDPWLAVHCFGHYAAGTRSLRILGKPEIPTELDLSRRDDLEGWWADMYNDQMTGENPAWKRSGDEIVGSRNVAWEGRSRESLLQYHRPMLEDGQIAYEFFHIPGQTHVDPALGRMVLMLKEDGVKIHWLTDAQFERGQLPADNLFVEQDHRRGPGRLPMKSNDWNRVVLDLKADVATLQLNGEVVYERPLEATNLRTFGLFHFAGDTDVRVRNVVYRGNWPRTLPAIEQQELAGNDLELASFKEGDLPATFSWDFQSRKPGNLVPSNFPSSKYIPDDEGLRLVHEPNPQPQTDSVGFQWPQVVIGGDFEVTLGYRDFQSTTASTNHQVPRVEIILSVGGGFGQHTQTLALTHRRLRDNSMSIASIQGIRRNPPAEEWLASDRNQASASGRIRIARNRGVAYFHYAKPGAKEWELLERRVCSTADIKDLIVGLRCEDLTSTASVVLTEFSVKAQRLEYIPRFDKGDLPAALTWNFQGARPKGLQTWAENAPNVFEQAADGIKINRPAGDAQKGVPVGFNWRGLLRGDFEVTLAYRDFESTTDRTDWQIPRVEVHIPIGGPDNTPENTHTATAGHRRRRDGVTGITSGVGERQDNGQKAWKANDQVTTRISGRLRVIRMGDTIHALAAPPGSDDFTLIASRPASAGPINSMSFAIRSESRQSAVSVVFTEVSIRAEELTSE